MYLDQRPRKVQSGEQESGTLTDQCDQSFQYNAQPLLTGSTLWERKSQYNNKFDFLHTDFETNDQLKSLNSEHMHI